MPTKFYFPSTGAPSLTPAYGSGWGTTTNAARRQMVKTRISSADASADGVGTAATDNQLIRQCIYEAETLSAQSLTGTVKGVFRMTGSNPSVGALAIRIAETNGTTTNEILAITSSTDNTTPPLNGGGNTNRRLETGSNTFDIPVSATLTAGYNLLIEIGYRDNSTNATRFATVFFGDDSGVDLLEDETSATADDPWIEFSMTIAFGGGGGSSILRQMMQHHRARQASKPAWTRRDSGILARAA